MSNVIAWVLGGKIYALLLWGLYGDGGVNRGLIVGLGVFFVVHILLHLAFYNHPENRFRSVFSYVLILGPAYWARSICYSCSDTLALDFRDAAEGKECVTRLWGGLKRDYATFCWLLRRRFGDGYPTVH